MVLKQILYRKLNKIAFTISHFKKKHQNNSCIFEIQNNFKLKKKSMFTIEQIKAAHAKVQTGADFPNYIQDLIILGVKGYDTYVSNGNVEYFGVNDYKVASDEKYPEIKVADFPNKERFIEFLLLHQSGETDYLTFCHHAAQCGIAKWSVNIIAMVCTYFDASGTSILIEKIPS